MKIAVIGGGASGMLAAYSAAENGASVTLFEKNEKLGKKLYITGKGRCNFTNDTDVEGFLSNVVTNSKFLMSSIYGFTPQDCKNFFSEKMPIKTERGNRVFPVSDKSSDVIRCLENYCRSVGVKIRLNEKVRNISAENGKIIGITTVDGFFECEKVIICTGGKSYPLTGSDGDGYRFALKTGHTLTDLNPGLVALNLKGDFYKSLQGLSLKNVRLSAESEGKKIYSEFGEMLFTHFGISGPIVLSLSSFINKSDLKKVKLYLDLKPALTEEQLDARVLRDFEKFRNRALKNSLDELLPKAIIPVIMEKSGIPEDKKNTVITSEERKNLIAALKNFDMEVASLRDFSEAIITSGGVCVKEINPKTMESKLVKGLYFAGEVLDVDALTGGFNLQIAFATGRAAGVNSAKED